MSDLGQNTGTARQSGAGSTFPTPTATRPGPWFLPRSPARSPGLSWGMDTDAAGELYALTVAASGPPVDRDSIHGVVPAPLNEIRATNQPRKACGRPAYSSRRVPPRRFDYCRAESRVVHAGPASTSSTCTALLNAERRTYG